MLNNNVSCHLLGMFNIFFGQLLSLPYFSFNWNKSILTPINESKILQDAVANSADPNKMLHSVTSDQGLYCTGLSV